MSTIAQTPDHRPDAADDMRLTGRWVAALANHLGEMPRAQRQELLRAVRDFKRDLDAIRLGVPR
jgi:hypothetical protein